MKNFLSAILCGVAVSAMIVLSAVGAVAKPRHKAFKTTDPAFFKTEQAHLIGEQILMYQRCTGGWPKNTDLVTPFTPEKTAEVLAGKSRTDDSTIDNNATTMEMKFLARLNDVVPDARYGEAFTRGVEFLLSGQYDNGGWPQFWPDPKGYQVHITYNDNAMVNTLELFQGVLSGERPYRGLVDDATCEKLRASVAKAVDVILATQIVTDGQPTVWCQQHDRDTYAPAKARAYELPSYCSQESANILKLLMSLPEPDDRVKRAIHGGMKWFDTTKIRGMRLVRDTDDTGEIVITRLVADATAPTMWARYYDLENCLPYVCDRDGVPRRTLEEIGLERRNGYGWYDERPAEIFEIYDRWADRYDPSNKLNVSL